MQSRNVGHAYMFNPFASEIKFGKEMLWQPFAIVTNNALPAEAEWKTSMQFSCLYHDTIPANRAVQMNKVWQAVHTFTPTQK